MCSSKQSKSKIYLHVDKTLNLRPLASDLRRIKSKIYIRIYMYNLNLKSMLVGGGWDNSSNLIDWHAI